MELRCAAWARQEAVDPIGTAGSYDGFCCVEWPLPWPRDLSEVPELVEVAEQAGRRRLRLQGLAPRAGSATARVVVYRRPARGEADAGFVAYVRSEVETPPGDTVEAARWLLDREPGDPAGAARVRADVLVCAHGRRDVCCGARGSALVAELGDGLDGDGVRLWRTSHTGGHRFAATVIVLPEGTLWAWLDAPLLRRVVARSGPAADVAPFYRGCAGLPSPAAQAVERAVLAETGWGLFDCRRTGTELGGGRVRLDVEAPGGGVRAWEATVDVARVMPVPDCGAPVTQARKTEPELVVRGLRPVVPGG